MAFMMGSSVRALSIAMILMAAMEPLTARRPPLTIEGAKLELRQAPFAPIDATVAGIPTRQVEAKIGTNIWSDRNYRITSISDELLGASLFQPTHYVNRGTMSITSNRDAEIFIALYILEANREGGLMESLPADGWTLRDGWHLTFGNRGLEKVWAKSIKAGETISFTSTKSSMTFAILIKGVTTTTSTTTAPTTTTTTTSTVVSAGCQDTNVLCKMEPAFLLDILCQIKTVSEQCPNRCNSCPEIEATTTSTTTTTTTTTTPSETVAFNEGDYSYCFANCNGGVQNAAPGGANDGSIVYGDFSCNEEMGGLYAASSGSMRHIVIPLKGGSSIDGPKTVAVLVKHGAGSEGKVPREFRLWRSMILNSEPYPRARAEFPQCGSKKFLGPINNMFSQTEFVLMVLRSGEQGTAMFRNGIKVASNDCTTPIPASDRMWLGANHFKGTFKSFAMWNRELSDDEVASLDPTKLTC